MESAIKSRRLLPGQHFLRGTTAKSGKPDRVLYTIHQEKSLLEVCRCVCGQCLRAPREEPARVPEDTERLQKRKDRFDPCDISEPLWKRCKRNDNYYKEVKANGYRSVR